MKFNPLKQNMYDIQLWVILILVLGILIFVFGGMFVMSWFSKKRTKEELERKEKGKAIVQQNTNNTRKELIIFIEDLFNEHKNYDEKNIHENVSKLKSKINKIIENKIKSDDFIEYELAFGKDDLVLLIYKLKNNPFTVWHKFLINDLNEIKNNEKWK